MPMDRLHDVVEVVQGIMNSGRREFTGAQFVVRLSTSFVDVCEVGRGALQLLGRQAVRNDSCESRKGRPHALCKASSAGVRQRGG